MDAVSASIGDGWLAILVAFVAYFILSFLWWGPIMGGKWAKEMGISMDEKPSMAVPLLLQALSTLLIAYVFWNVQAAFFVTHDGDNGVMLGEWPIGGAIFGAVMTWLGFFVPVQLGRVAWEKASWTLFGINVVGHLIGLVAMAVCFSLLS